MKTFNLKNNEVFKELTFKKKIDYLWDYYKIPIIGMISAFAIIIYILYLTFRHVPDDILNITLINSSITSENEITIGNEFLDYKGYDSEKFQVSIGAHITIDNEMSSRSREFVAALILAEEIDILVWDQEAHEYVKSLDANVNLEEYLDETYIEKYINYAVYENESLIGYSFDGSQEISKELAMKESFFGIVQTGINKEEASIFIEYLLDKNYGSVN